MNDEQLRQWLDRQLVGEDIGEIRSADDIQNRGLVISMKSGATGTLPVDFLKDAVEGNRYKKYVIWDLIRTLANAESGSYEIAYNGDFYIRRVG